MCEIERPTVYAHHLEQAVSLLMGKVSKQMGDKGHGAFVTHHEMLGALTEEFHETVDAVREGYSQRVLEELLDIGVAAVWGVASILTMQESDNETA